MSVTDFYHSRATPVGRVKLIGPAEQSAALDLFATSHWSDDPAEVWLTWLEIGDLMGIDRERTAAALQRPDERPEDE